jgi:LacI family transcriptional regulator
MAVSHRIGLVLGSHGEANRAVARGVAAFARMGREWIFNAIDLVPGQVPTLARWRPDGVLAMVVDPILGEAVCEIGVPLVNTAKLYSHPQLPRVDHDDLAIGRLAARHFLDRGFRSFGFLGLPLLPFSLDRERGYRETVEAAGFSCESAMIAGETSLHNASGWPDDPQAIGRWLKRLAKPVAVMACSDWHGWRVAELCRDRGIRVPEDVALIGVDNDEPWCSLSHPPLSSVITNAERIGYEAADLLMRLMESKRPLAAAPLELPPIGVLTRRSSDTVAIDDREVAIAARFIREQAHRPITVTDVLDATATGRRSLERRFRRSVGRSIGQEIRLAHVQKAKDLLSRTDLAMSQVAYLSGFTNAKRFSETFGRVEGVSPASYRARFQPKR